MLVTLVPNREVDRDHRTGRPIERARGHAEMLLKEVQINVASTTRQDFQSEQRSLERGGAPEVKIWGGVRGVGKAYPLDFEDDTVQNEMEAAAIAVNFYVASIPDLNAETVIDSSLAGVALKPMHLRDVVRWLKTSPDGHEFVEKENLQVFVARFTFD